MGVALSVSTGDGLSNYFVYFKYKRKLLENIIATDIVDNPVDKEGQKLLKNLGDWEFKKLKRKTLFSFKNWI